MFQQQAAGSYKEVGKKLKEKAKRSKKKNLAYTLEVCL